MNKDKKQYKILVVEDNPGDFLLIEDYIHEQFARPEIIELTTYQEAAAQLENATEKADVILLDLSLPDKTGEELVKAILERSDNIPVIVLTGFSDIDFSTRSIGQGISDYLVKDDLNAAILYKSIVYAIERKRNFLQLQESEKRYSLLFDLSPQPMFVYDEDTLVFETVNKAAVDHYGYSEAEFKKMKLSQIRVTENEELSLSLLEKRHRETEGIYKDELKHILKSGDFIDVEVYTTKLPAKNKNSRSAIAVDVTERNVFEERETKSIIRTQEEERYEIGGELHDNVCQLLATSLMSMRMLRKPNHENFDEFYHSAFTYINMAIEEIRNLSHRLAPAFFDDSTFEEVVGSLIKSFNLTGKFEIEMDYDEKLSLRSMNKEIQLNLYRILQEQLRNISKYAKASKIMLSLKLVNKKLIMSISDNGVGFEPDKVRTGIGMANMKRRIELLGGNFLLESAPGKGCCVEVSVKEEIIGEKIEKSKNENIIV